MKTARILSGLLGFVLLILGVQWIIDPQTAAEDWLYYILKERAEILSSEISQLFPWYFFNVFSWIIN